MRVYIKVTIILLLISGCINKTTQRNDESEVSGKYLEEELSEVEIKALKLNSNYQAIDLVGTKNVGEFFDHRLRFYKIDKPDITINKTPVDELVLYFIDSALVKMRYELSNEVGSYLLDSLGMSKFKPLDDLSKDLLTRRKVYDKFTSRLHPDLSNYELIWRTDLDIRRYRVKSYDTLTKYFFYHEMYGYRQKVRELEVMYQMLEESIPYLGNEID